MNKMLIFIVSLFSFSALSVEHKFHGLVDIRYSQTDGIDSYLVGGYGKFRFNDGNRLSLSQVALNYSLDWDNTFSIHTTANGYVDDVKNDFGLTELYAQYKSLPTVNGYRIKAKAGIMYPNVSMTNVLTGWASPYTLSYSAINSWIAEELRHQGLELTISHLGKFSNSEHDFDLKASLFKANDPAGAMIAWHGWVITSRQTLNHEKLALPNSHIGFVPDESDVYLELDDRIGFQVNTEWIWREHGRVKVGYYDNNADPKVVENIQWAWRTRFFHLGVKWQLTNTIDFIAQYLTGDTLMQSSSGQKDLVYNDYDSAYLMLSKRINNHRVSARVETFTVDDKDQFSFDNNNEEGDAVTINYNYRISKHLFFNSEYSWINSERPSRIIKYNPINLIERQFQLGARYFF